MVGEWKRQAMEGMAAVLLGKMAAQEISRAGGAEVENLHAKIGQLLVEREFYGQGIGAMSLEKPRQMIEPDHPDLSIVRQCALIGVSRSGFYHRPVGETAENLALMRVIDAQFLETPLVWVAPDGAPTAA